jgi:hypothetical protein
LKPRIEAVDIASNSVHVRRSCSFDSLASFVANIQRAGIADGYLSNLRMEKDTAGHLRMIFSSTLEERRYLKLALKAWKTQGSKLDLRIELPGKILSSDLPNTNGNSTWIAMDATNEQSFEAFHQFLEKPATVVAEFGDLKLDQPLDSKAAWRLEQVESSPALPITDAGAGFTAEAQSMSISTAYYFPEGRQRTNDFDDAERSPNADSRPCVTVRAKLSPPPGREVKFVSDFAALGATDDKGRAIKPSTDPDTEEWSQINYGDGNTAGPASSCSVQLQLALPEADAQSIRELSGQAVLDTVGKWNELALTNIEGSVSNAIDLSSILPGAKLTVTKFSKKAQQVSIKLRLTGPPEIRQIEIQYGSGSEPPSSISEVKFANKGSESTRDLHIRFVSAQTDPNESADSPVLTVRFPEDERRERLNFKLSGLDLF